MNSAMFFQRTLATVLRAAFPVFLVFLFFSQVSAQEKSTPKSEYGSSSAVWKRTIALLVKESLWIDRDAYDASHTLMIPLHYAFFSQDKEGISEFEILMARFAVNELPTDQLHQAQWMYFVSRYLVLKTQGGYPIEGSDAYLLQRLSFWLHNRWLFEPAYQWGRLPFFGTKERLKYLKSAEDKFDYSYYKAVTDYELFLFSIAADIDYVANKNDAVSKKISEPVRNTIREVLEGSVQVVRDSGQFTGKGGWLFQVGVWADHPDFQFAGHTKLAPDLKESPVTNVSEDSSHSHRWPLFFLSLVNAPGISKSDRNHLQKAYGGFCKQFHNEVVKVDGKKVLLRNYMDGRNGLYRYKYSTVGKNVHLGYGPYALSGILGESWYPFCANGNKVFESYKNAYPLTQEVVDIYVGPNTTRVRNPMFRWPDYFVDGFAQMHAYQAAYISRAMQTK